MIKIGKVKYHFRVKYKSSYNKTPCHTAYVYSKTQGSTDKEKLDSSSFFAIELQSIITLENNLAVFQSFFFSLGAAKE